MVFWTRFSYFKYQVLLFRLFNAVISFQGYINKILVKKFNIFIIIHLNNIFIYIEDLGQAHIDAVYLDLKKLQKHDLFANLKKYQFYKNKVWFLG